MIDDCNPFGILGFRRQEGQQEEEEEEVEVIEGTPGQMLIYLLAKVTRPGNRL